MGVAVVEQVVAVPRRGRAFAGLGPYRIEIFVVLWRAPERGATPMLLVGVGSDGIGMVTRKRDLWVHQQVVLRAPDGEIVEAEAVQHLRARDVRQDRKSTL